MQVPFSLAGLPWFLCNHVPGERKVMLEGYNVTMEMTGTYPTCSWSNASDIGKAYCYHGDSWAWSSEQQSF